MLLRAWEWKADRRYMTAGDTRQVGDGSHLGWLSNRPGDFTGGLREEIATEYLLAIKDSQLYCRMPIQILSTGQCAGGGASMCIAGSMVRQVAANLRREVLSATRMAQVQQRGFR